MNNKSPQEQHTLLEVKIMGRSFRMACQPQERAALAKAVNMVEGKMQAIRHGGVVSLDNMAILAALQIAHESLVGSNQDQPLLGLDNPDALDKIDHIQALANSALAKVETGMEGHAAQMKADAAEADETKADEAKSAVPAQNPEPKGPVQQTQLFE